MVKQFDARTPERVTLRAAWAADCMARVLRDSLPGSVAGFTAEIDSDTAGESAGGIDSVQYTVEFSDAISFELLEDVLFVDGGFQDIKSLRFRDHTLPDDASELAVARTVEFTCLVTGIPKVAEQSDTIVSGDEASDLAPDAPEPEVS